MKGGAPKISGCFGAGRKAGRLTGLADNLIVFQLSPFFRRANLHESNTVSPERGTVRSGLETGYRALRIPAGMETVWPGSNLSRDGKRVALLDLFGMAADVRVAPSAGRTTMVFLEQF